MDQLVIEFGIERQPLTSACKLIEVPSYLSERFGSGLFDIYVSI